MGEGKASFRVEISRKTIRDPLLSLRDAIARRPDLSATFAGEEPPLRAELFSREQMAQHGRVLAASHRLSTGAAPTGC